MIWFWISITLLHKFALGLAVASSTYAIIFYIQGIQEGTIDSSERRFLDIVSTVLRIALAIIISTQLILVSSYIPDGLPILFKNPLFVMSWALVAVIMVSSVLTQFHKMPTLLTPVFSGCSWYALFILSTWPGPLPLNLVELLGAYLVFLVLFGGVLMLIKRRFVPSPPLPAIS